MSLCSSWPTSSNSFKPWTSGNILYGIVMAEAGETDNGFWGRPGQEMFARAVEVSQEFDLAEWLQVKSNGTFGRLIQVV